MLTKCVPIIIIIADLSVLLLLLVLITTTTAAHICRLARLDKARLSSKRVATTHRLLNLARVALAKLILNFFSRGKGRLLLLRWWWLKTGTEKRRYFCKLHMK